MVFIIVKNEYLISKFCTKSTSSPHREHNNDLKTTKTTYTRPDHRQLMGQLSIPHPPDFELNNHVGGWELLIL